MGNKRSRQGCVNHASRNVARDAAVSLMHDSREHAGLVTMFDCIIKCALLSGNGRRISAHQSGHVSEAWLCKDGNVKVNKIMRYSSVRCVLESCCRKPYPRWGRTGVLRLDAIWGALPISCSPPSHTSIAEHPSCDFPDVQIGYCCRS